jgi:hypothetical protein
MERRNPFYRFVLMSALVAGLAACGDQSANQAATQGAHTELAECSVAMPANSTALEVQRAIAAVLAGRLDPCNGAVDLKGTSAALLRIDGEDDLSIRIFFRILRGNEQLP